MPEGLAQIIHRAIVAPDIMIQQTVPLKKAMILVDLEALQDWTALKPREEVEAQLGKEFLAALEQGLSSTENSGRPAI